MYVGNKMNNIYLFPKGAKSILFQSLGSSVIVFHEWHTWRQCSNPRTSTQVNIWGGGGGGGKGGGGGDNKREVTMRRWR